MTTDTLTADTITATEIRTLRREAKEHSDHDQVLVCDLALAPHEVRNADGSPLIGPNGQNWTRSQARAACADVINQTRAQS